MLCHLKAWNTSFSYGCSSSFYLQSLGVGKGSIILIVLVNDWNKSESTFRKILLCSFQCDASVQIKRSFTLWICLWTHLGTKPCQILFQKIPCSIYALNIVHNNFNDCLSFWGTLKPLLLRNTEARGRDP